MPAVGEAPYRDLFIYHIQGVVKDEDTALLRRSFLGNWVEDQTSFLFFDRPSREAVCGILKGRPWLELVADYGFSYEQWQGGGLEVLSIGSFLIAPPWVPCRPGEGDIPILLDPGVVFGNGLHPTTGDCLRALSWLGGRCSLADVLDIGTGTGILALAAARLGARRVLAVDLNPLCAKTARRNAALNGLEGVVEAVEGGAEAFIGESADLVIANIHYDVLRRLIGSEGVQRKTWLILSGLLRSEAREIRRVSAELDFRLRREWDHEMTWYTFVLENCSRVCGHGAVSRHK